MNQRATRRTLDTSNGSTCHGPCVTRPVVFCLGQTVTAKLESTDVSDEDLAGPTKIRSIRITDADWLAIRKAAERHGFGSTSEFIRATMLKESRSKR